MSPEQFDTILEGIAAGESAKACLRDLDINPRVFWGYLGKDEEAANRYARARSRGMDKMAEEILDIVDDESIPADSRRVRIDPRKWLLSKLAPKKYGEKVDLTHAGPDGGPIVQQVEWLVTRAATDQDTGSISIPAAAKPV